MKRTATRPPTDPPHPPLLALALLTGLFVLLIPMGVRADEFDDFMHAKNAFDAGDYAEAVARFDRLLKEGLKNPAILIESHKLIAVSYLFIDNREKAEHHFTELLTLSPDSSLDPMIFPIEVVDFFLRVKEKNKERLTSIQQARAEEEKRKQAEEEARRKAEFEKLRRNVYLSQSRRESSLMVAFIPFGIGQFQNGHMIKGALFLGGELLLSATAVTTYILHESVRPPSKTPFESPKQREDYERLEAIYRITNWASLGCLAAVGVAGIIDSLYFYKRVTIQWKRVREKDVPRRLRPGVTSANLYVVPRVGDQTAGLTLLGYF